MQYSKRLRTSTRKEHPAVAYLRAQLAREGLGAQRACPPSEFGRMALFSRVHSPSSPSSSSSSSARELRPFTAQTQWSVFFENTLGQLMDEHLLDVVQRVGVSRLASHTLTQYEGHSLSYDHVLNLRHPYSFVSDLVIDYFMHLCNQAQDGLQDRCDQGCRTAYYTSTSFIPCILTRMRHVDSRSTLEREAFCRGVDRKSRAPPPPGSTRRISTVQTTPLYKMDFIYVPFNVGQEHFVLFVVDMRRQEIALFDSLDDSHERNTYQRGNRRQYRTSHASQASDSSGEECSSRARRGGLARVVQHWTKYPSLPDMHARYPDVNIAYHALVSFLHTYRRVCRQDYPHDIPKYAFLVNPPIFHGYYKHYHACQTGADCSIYVILNCMFGGPAFHRWNHVRADHIPRDTIIGQALYESPSPFEDGPPDFSHFSIRSKTKSAMLRRFLALLCFHPRVFSLDPSNFKLWNASERRIWIEYAGQADGNGLHADDDGDDEPPPPNSARYNLECKRVAYSHNMFIPFYIHNAVDRDGPAPMQRISRLPIFVDTSIRFGGGATLEIRVTTKRLRVQSSIRAASSSSRRTTDLFGHFRYAQTYIAHTQDFEESRYHHYMHGLRAKVGRYLQGSARNGVNRGIPHYGADYDMNFNEEEPLGYSLLPSPYIESTVRVHCASALKTPVEWSLVGESQHIEPRMIRLVLIGSQSLASPVHLFKRLYETVRKRLEGASHIVDVLYIHPSGGNLTHFDQAFPDMRTGQNTRTFTTPAYMLSAPELFEPNRDTTTHEQRVATARTTDNMLRVVSDLLYLDHHLSSRDSANNNNNNNNNINNSSSSTIIDVDIDSQEPLCPVEIRLFDGVSNDPTTGVDALRKYLLRSPPNQPDTAFTSSPLITDTYIMKEIPSYDKNTDAIVHTLLTCAREQVRSQKPSHVHIYNVPDDCGCLYVQTTRDIGLQTSTFGQTLERMKRDQIDRKVGEALREKRDPDADPQIRYLRNTTLGCMGFWLTRDECRCNGDHVDHSSRNYPSAQSNFVRTATHLRALHRRHHPK